MSSKKTPIAISIFPALDYVELIQYDEKSGEVETATSLPCQFDPLTRQMLDREQLAQTIRDLYITNRIPFSRPAVLVLPGFFTREIDLPSEFGKEELRFALVSEAERFYIFKKTEPHIDWIHLEEGRLLYAAFPKTEIEKYIKIFSDLAIPLYAIELSYFSIMRGLLITGALQDIVETNASWCLLVISDTSVFSSLHEGMQVVKSMDARISIMEDDLQSTLGEIQQDFDNFVEMAEFEKLIVINYSERIHTEDLVGKVSYSGNIVPIDQNASTLRSRGAKTGLLPCSLEGLGGVFYSQFPDMPHLNFIPDGGEDAQGIAYYRQETFKWLLVANVGSFILCLMLWGLLSLLGWQKEQSLKQLSDRLVVLNGSLSNDQLNEVNRKKFIKQAVQQNIKLNNFLVQLGSLTPKGVWLDKIEINAENIDLPLVIAVDGKALNLDEVNQQLVTNLNKNLPDASLEVATAAQSTTPDGQSYFTWTIKSKDSQAATETAPGAPPPILNMPNAPGGVPMPSPSGH